MKAGIQEYLQYVEAYTEQVEAFARELGENTSLKLATDRYHDYWEWRVQELEKERRASYEEAQSRMRLSCACKSMVYKIAHPLFDRIVNLAICQQTQSPLYEMP